MFKVLDLPVLSGRIGICPMPGRFSSYQTNFSSITDWRPQLVITVAQFFEMEKIGILQESSLYKFIKKIESRYS